MTQTTFTIWYKIYIGLLRAIGFLNNGFDVLAGVSPVVYNGKTTTVYDLFFAASPVAFIFWGITVIGLALALAFSMIEVTRRAADLKVEKTMGATLGHIGRSLLMFLITPLMVISVLQISAITMKKTSEMFYIANGGTTIDTAIFVMTAREAALTDPSVLKKFGSGVLSYSDADAVIDNLDGNKIMTWIGIPVSLMLIAVFALCLFVLCLRLFMLIVLYAVSPLFVSSMVLDNGERYRRWREVFFGKAVSGLSMILAVEIFTFVIVPILTSDIAFVRSVAADIALKCLFAAGCVYAMYKSTSTLTKIIAPRAESEGSLIKMALAVTVKKAWSTGKNVVRAGVGAVQMASGDVQGGAMKLKGLADQTGVTQVAEKAADVAKKGTKVASGASKMATGAGQAASSALSLNPGGIVQGAVQAARGAAEVGQVAAQTAAQAAGKIAEKVKEATPRE